MFLDNLEEKFNINRKALASALDNLRSMLGDDEMLGNISGNAGSALESVFRYYGITDIGIDRELRDIRDIKEFLSMNGLLFNDVELSGEWWKKACGPIIASRRDGKLVTFIPDTFGYHTTDPQTGRRIKVNGRVAQGLLPQAINFFKPLSRGKISQKEFFRHCLDVIPTRDYIFIIVFCIIATLLSMLTPVANKILFNDVIPSGTQRAILPICSLLLSAGISAILFNLCRNFMLVRVKDKFNANIQPSLMARLLYLPSSFFKKRSAGDLGQRVLSINNIYSLFTSQILAVCATCLFVVMYILIAVVYAKEMIWLITMTVVVAIILGYVKGRRFYKEYSDKIPKSIASQDFTYNALSGIQKIKNNRAEFRVFAQWASRYRSSEVILKYYKIYAVLIVCLGPFLAYLTAWKSNIAISDYIAFMSAYGVMLASFEEGMIVIQTIVNIVPYLSLLEPILQTEPEISGKMPLVHQISGSIDINHVSFAYEASTMKVLDDVSLHIDAGESIGLVGSSGCGKSTLMKLMLGFDKPTGGSIFYGQYNINNVNLNSLRQFVGFCPQAMQIFPGSIAENIAFSVTGCTEAELWEAARVACIDEDIRRLPNGMQTILGEGGSGLSGGQCQRLLIARAVISKPKVLFMDEATSALDNITQKQVVENLGRFGCTRIAIAHRLSTVMSCDRIFVLDKGKIIEEGSPSELLARKGFFYQLTIRQQ